MTALRLGRSGQRVVRAKAKAQPREAPLWLLAAVLPLMLLGGWLTQFVR